MAPRCRKPTHEPPICARSVPKAALARPLPTRQTRQKGRLNFLYPVLCDGKVLMTHEGGYNTWTVPFFGLAVMEELSGIRTVIEDPFLPMAEMLGGQSLQPHQDVEISAAEKLLEGIAS